MPYITFLMWIRCNGNRKKNKKQRYSQKKKVKSKEGRNLGAQWERL